MAEKVRLSLQISEDVNRFLEQMADDTSGTKSDVLRRALALLKVAHEGKRKGKRLGFVSDSGNLETEIVGPL